jgi:hypothetical protein
MLGSAVNRVHDVHGCTHEPDCNCMTQPRTSLHVRQPCMHAESTMREGREIVLRSDSIQRDADMVVIGVSRSRVRTWHN